VLFETSCRFVYLFKLSWLPLPHRLGTFFGRNEVDFPQFETVVFQHDGGHRAVPFTSDNDEAIIRSEPHLESFLFAVWRRTDFAKTELLEKCTALTVCMNCGSVGASISSVMTIHPRGRSSPPCKPYIQSSPSARQPVGPPHPSRRFPMT